MATKVILSKCYEKWSLTELVQTIEWHKRSESSSSRRILSGSWCLRWSGSCRGSNRRKVTPSSSFGPSLASPWSRNRPNFEAVHFLFSRLATCQRSGHPEEGQLDGPSQEGGSPSSQDQVRTLGWRGPHLPEPVRPSWLASEGCHGQGRLVQDQGDPSQGLRLDHQRDQSFWWVLDTWSYRVWLCI